MVYAEKRDFLRMPIDCELKFSAQGNDDHKEGHVINLSSKGILFTAAESLTEGALLDIVLTPSNSLTPPMHATVVVIRSLNNNAAYEIACEIEQTG
ncbi:MAG: hypothetical protein ACI9LO_002134 [Planctomycetota bacterium]|jgi:hypothetical protein